MIVKLSHRPRCPPPFVAVDARWHGKEGFDAFVRDMGVRPAGGTIERVDNDGPYCPENCAWATRLEQSKNKRNTRLITANGETKHLADWARHLGCNSAAILARIKAGMSEEEAVTKAVPERPNAKLTMANAEYVRQTYPMKTAQQLATELGVSKKTVLNIIHNRTFVQ
jgi:DNA-binding CsgD family transcriptional regulator